MAADRPVHETDAEEAIEITKEMIEAGASMCVLFGLVDDPESAAIAIYDAMRKANQK